MPDFGQRNQENALKPANEQGQRICNICGAPWASPHTCNIGPVEPALQAPVEPAAPEPTISDEACQVSFDRLVLYRLLEEARSDLALAKVLWYAAKAGVGDGKGHAGEAHARMVESRRQVDLLRKIVGQVEQSGAAIPEPAG